MITRLDFVGIPSRDSERSRAFYVGVLGLVWMWRSNAPLEGAIYAENIPFNETRDYVRKVMSNTMYYSRLLSRNVLTLKQRLGTIEARPGNDE